MKKVAAFWLIYAIVATYAFAAQLPEEPDLKGQEAVLYCAENGQILLDKNMDKPVHPASITKLMTALLVLESDIDLKQRVTVSHDAVFTIERNSTHIALDEGEEVNLEQMMYAMLLTSANDAANVLAEAVDGTQEAFAKHMTARAAELGCRHTNFVNAHGLDSPMHYTTAYDMARITAELLKYDEFTKISGTQVYHMPPTNKQSEERAFWNKQNILNPQSKFYDETAIAGKNGYTKQAGHTLVTVARRDEVTLIAVTLGTHESRYDKHKDTKAMFDYGYGQFDKQTILPNDILKAAQDAGMKADEESVQPIMILAPTGRKTDELTFAAEGEYLTASWGGADKLAFQVPLERDLPAPTSGGGEEVEPAAAQAQAPKKADIPLSKPMMLLVVGVAGIAVVILSFVAYRTMKIRRKREEIRAMRRKHRARNHNYDDWNE